MSKTLGIDRQRSSRSPALPAWIEDIMLKDRFDWLQPGTLVKLKDSYLIGTAGLPLYTVNISEKISLKTRGYFESNDVGIIIMLDDNMSLILVSTGKLGWCWNVALTVIDD